MKIMMIKIKHLIKGDLFIRKVDSSIIYVRGSYVRGIRRYSCYRYDDVNCVIFLKGDTDVFVEF